MISGKPKIISFSGKAGHGKDSSVQILKKLLEEKGQRVIAINYADFLKYLAKTYMGWDGIKDEKGRTLMQQLGTEKVRHRYPNFWVDIVISITKVFENDVDYVLIGDCRFPNEITRWKEEGYNITSIHIQRVDFDNGLTDEQKNHESETALDNFLFDVKLRVKTLEELEEKLVIHQI